MTAPGAGHRSGCGRANALSAAAGLGGGKKSPSIIYLTLADVFGSVFSVKGGPGHHIPGVGTKRLCFPQGGSSRCRAWGCRSVPTGGGTRCFVAMEGTRPSLSWVTVTWGGDTPEGTLSPGEGRAAQPRAALQAGDGVAPSGGAGGGGSGDGVPGAEHHPASSHAGCALSPLSLSLAGLRSSWETS